MISGQKPILLFSREETVKSEFNKINKRLTRSSIYAQGISGFMGPLNNLLNNLSYLIVVVLGAFLILKGNYGLTVGTVFSFILYMRQFTRPINEIMNLFNTIQSAMVGAERVFQVMDETREEDIKDTKPIDELQGEVELKGVTFSYVEGEVIEVAKMAHAQHFIKQLPQGHKTVLSDNGGNLSQGQRQLLAIERAMLSKSQILILDEATSSIDTRTEVAIQKAMLNLMEGKTSFVIAHRLNTIRNADKILVVNNGEIVERGNHNTLIDKNSFCANLYNSQFKTGMAL